MPGSQVATTSVILYYDGNCTRHYIWIRVKRGVGVALIVPSISAGDEF